ncbi:hypothetical protein ACRPZ9_003983, partial [Escherichia coli]
DPETATRNFLRDVFFSLAIVFAPLTGSSVMMAKRNRLIQRAFVVRKRPEQGVKENGFARG